MGHRRRHPTSLAARLAGLVLLLVACLLLHLGFGGTWLGPAEVIRALFAQGDPGASHVVWQIRLPRGLGCVFVGAMLGLVGSSFQALFRNPIAEPYVVGVSSGAAVGGVAAHLLNLGALWGGLGTMSLAFVGGLGSLALVFSLARRRGVVHVQTLLLAGVVVGAMLSALTTFGLFLAGEDSNRVLRWLMGSTTPMFWDRLWVLSACLFVGGAALMAQAKGLNVFAVGESAAQAVGVHVGRLKLVVLVAGTAMVATTVGAVGIIGFLGLVAPHIARRVVGLDWRVSLPASGLLGASLLLVADIAAQRVVPGLELPVGVVTALIGAPVLLAVLHREQPR